jgi:Kef-type K+ transport system membrane component KefB
MNQFLVMLGLLLLAASVLSILLHTVKQSSIVALITIGIVAGIFRNSIRLTKEMIDVFTEVGILLLLFTAGLEIDFESFKTRWKLILTNGLGQILINTLFGILLGLVVLDITRTASLIYFGLCLTFSSTIICISYLKNKKELESFHGQMVLGLMVLQDITAVMSLVMLKSLESQAPLLPSIGLMLLKMALLIGFLYASYKTFLPVVFRYLAKASELMFIGTLGWALGIAALCEIFHFSPEIGAFMAGAALSVLPYKLEIQDKVEPQKDFGIILFFLALGFNLELSAQLRTYILPIVLTSLFVLLVTPMIMLAIGYFEKIKSRPSFFMGVIINQISEFSLILATLCKEAGVFNQEMFTVITFACITTIILSTVGQQFIPSMYKPLQRHLAFLDRRSKMQIELQKGGFELNDHIIILTYNEMAEKIIENYAAERILLIDIDPEIYELCSKIYDNVRCFYADMYDPDTWETAKFDSAKIIISCLVRGQEAEIAISEWLKERASKALFIVTTDSRPEALELYEKGATYVIETEDLAAEYVGRLFQENKSKPDLFKRMGEGHYRRLQKMSKDKTFNFT